VYFLNRKGELYKKLDFSKYSLNYIELCSPIIYDRNQLYIGISRYNIDFPEKAKISDYLEEYKNKNYFPLIFVEKSCFDSTSDVNLKMNAFYKRFVQDDAMTFENLKFAKSSKFFCFSSVFSDSVYVFDKEFQLVKSARINSDISKINSKPISILTYLKNRDKLSENIRGSSFISDFKYDSFRNTFVCLIRDKMDGDLIPFSIMILDENLEKIAEKKFDSHSYYDVFYISKDGLFIEKKNPIKRFSRTFSKFIYE